MHACMHGVHFKVSYLPASTGARVGTCVGCKRIITSVSWMPSDLSTTFILSLHPPLMGGGAWMARPSPAKRASSICSAMLAQAGGTGLFGERCRASREGMGGINMRVGRSLLGGPMALDAGAQVTLGGSLGRAEVASHARPAVLAWQMMCVSRLPSSATPTPEPA